MVSKMEGGSLVGVSGRMKQSHLQLSLTTLEKQHQKHRIEPRESEEEVKFSVHKTIITKSVLKSFKKLCLFEEKR